MLWFQPVIVNHPQVITISMALQLVPSHWSLWSGWWFGTFFIFPYIGNNHPNWLIFFRGVETTNQWFIMCDDLRMVIPCYPITFLSQCHHHCMSLSVPSSSLFLAGREAESARFTAETATDGEVRGSKLYISWPTLRYSIYKCNIPAYVYIYIFIFFVYLFI